MGYILVVDDDENVLISIQEILEDEGYTVEGASSGQLALDKIGKRKPDLLILDIVMPEMSGLQVCRAIRADPFMARLPILFLTARARPSDIAEGLDAGADDYLVKPFEVIELPARVRALLRRAPTGPLDAESDIFKLGNLTLYNKRSAVEVQGRMIELTAVEHRILHYLMLFAGQPASPQKLLEEVWLYPPGTGNPNLVHVHIANLRTKLALPPEDPQYIRNVRGQGYVINA